jgi:regulator of protease activity HflC (stomatin/prohibitin superfamily)
MSSRARFITGTIVIGIVLALVTFLNAQTSINVGWTPSWLNYVEATVAWYLLCWCNIIREWNRRPVLRFGRYVQTAGPGLAFIEPLLHTTLPDVPVQDVVRELDVPNLQTKDNVGIGLKALLTYRVDKEKVQDAVVEVANVNDAVIARGLTSVNDQGSTVDLSHFLENRSKFGDDAATLLKERVKNWGVIVQAVEIKSFKISDSRVEEAIAMKARAQKEAEAELARANMQSQIATALNAAANTLDDKGWMLKQIETLIELCRSANNNTILIPADFQSAIGSLSRMLTFAREGSATKTTAE